MYLMCLMCLKGPIVGLLGLVSALFSFLSFFLCGPLGPLFGARFVGAILTFLQISTYLKITSGWPIIINVLSAESSRYLFEGYLRTEKK